MHVIQKGRRKRKGSQHEGSQTPVAWNVGFHSAPASLWIQHHTVPVPDICQILDIAGHMSDSHCNCEGLY